MTRTAFETIEEFWRIQVVVLMEGPLHGNGTESTGRRADLENAIPHRTKFGVCLRRKERISFLHKGVLVVVFMLLVRIQYFIAKVWKI